MNTAPHRHPASYRSQRCLPVPQLAPFIDNYLMLESSSGGALPRLLPGTGAACFFVYGAPLIITSRHDTTQETLSSPFLLCNRHHVLELSDSGASGFIVVNFRPGRLRYFTDTPFSELQDRVTPAGELWGARSQEIVEQLAHSTSFSERAALLSAFFCQLLQERGKERLDPLLDVLYLSPGTRIADLAEQSGLSLRHFERLFASTYGVSPKYFARVARMQQVARKLALDPGVGTLESALDAGFFDQSHFIHELHKLVGLTPAELARGVRERPHFYNPKALNWYICHVQRMVNGQEPGNPAHAQTLMQELLSRRTV